jgi:hypothetical protein
MALLLCALVGAVGENVEKKVWTQVGPDIDGEAADDRSGFSVAMSSNGNIVAVGAYKNGGRGAESGHVRVFEHNGTAWSQLGHDIDGEAAGDNSGVSVAMSSDGKRVAVGAHQNDDGGPNSGHVRVYEYDETNSTWTQMGGDIDGENSYDLSGLSVAMSLDGSIVAVGAINNEGSSGSDAYQGHVRVRRYDASTSNWVQLGNDIDGKNAGDMSGESIAMSLDGLIVAVGASFNNVNGGASGHVRVFEYDSTTSTWSQLGHDIGGESAGDFSGFSVAMSSDGKRIAVGAHRNGDNGLNSGHVRVYEYGSTMETWFQLGYDIDGENAGDESGYSVAMSSDGSRVVVGAHVNDGSGSNSGHVRVYEYDSPTITWNQMGLDIDGEAAEDRSGHSVAMSSDGMTVAVGAPLNNGNGDDSGHVRVYTLKEVFSVSGDDNGLSKGAFIGIVAGSVAGAVALMAAVIYACSKGKEEYGRVNG